MTDPIPFLPRPWRVVRRAGLEPSIQDAGGAGVFRVYSSDIHEQAEVAEHIVRLVNAEPEIVAALEAAGRFMDAVAPDDPRTGNVRAALAKLRG